MVNKKPILFSLQLSHFLIALAIRFIDSTNKITKAICGLVKHDPIRGSKSPKESVLPAGLVWDSRCKCLVMNAQAGFLQWYDPELDTMSFNVIKFSYFFFLTALLTVLSADGHC